LRRPVSLEQRVAHLLATGSDADDDDIGIAVNVIERGVDNIALLAAEWRGGDQQLVGVLDFPFEFLTCNVAQNRTVSGEQVGALHRIVFRLIARRRMAGHGMDRMLLARMKPFRA
jgi:hypothetical protein